MATSPTERAEQSLVNALCDTLIPLQSGLGKKAARSEPLKLQELARAISDLIDARVQELVHQQAVEPLNDRIAHIDGKIEGVHRRIDPLTSMLGRI